MEQFGKYTLERRLGAGGMAEVFLARSAVAQGLAKQLVIKKIHPAFARSKHFVTMFFDEARIALGLNHPNIVQVFDFGHVAQTYFLAMEHVDGLDLLRLLQEGARQGRRVPHGIGAYVVQQLCKGLDYAHRKTDEYGEPLGVVHRDVSPQNVLISYDGSVKIVDFGIARSRDVQEEEGVVKGKFAYMSPEQAKGEAVDHRSDVFSAGVVLFEVACARPLFTGKGKEILDQVKSGAIPRPRDCDPTMPPELDAIILKALAYDADARYQTARDLQNALGRFQFTQAKEGGDLPDSGVLAQFVAQIVPKTPRAANRTPSETPFLSVMGGSEPAVDADPRPGATKPPPKEHATAIERRAQTTSREKKTGAGPSHTARGVTAATPPPQATAAMTAPPSANRGATETRERRRILVLEGHMWGLDELEERVGKPRAEKAVAEFMSIAEAIAFKSGAHAHRVPRKDLAGAREGFTSLIGLPTGAEDDPTRAIRLALALVDALDGIGRDVEPELRLSVGLQRGVATVRKRSPGGVKGVGVEVGDAALALARRLAREARGGEVLVGGGIYRLARHDWNFEEVATLELDGTDAGTAPGDEDVGPRRARVYRLRGPKEREQRMRDRAVGVSELVGRDLEHAALRTAYDQVREKGERRSVLIVGDEGVGKRTLIASFLRTIPVGEAMIVRACGRPAISDVAFGIVADAARDLLGLAEGAEPKEVQRRIDMTMSFLFPAGEGGRDIAGIVSAIGALIGLKRDGVRDAEGVNRGRIGRALKRLEERLTRDEPLILVIEDIHFADRGSYELFQGMLRETSRRPVLYLTTGRPDPAILELAAEPGAQAIHLDELGPAERMAVIQDRFVPGADVKALAEQIAAKAGGNPLFIREIIDSLVDRGVLAPVAEHAPHAGKLMWKRPGAPVAVPTSIEAVVASRLDRLSRSQREVIARAALLGSTFAVGDVAGLLGRSPAEVLAELRALVPRGLVVPIAPEVSESAPIAFRFRSEMTRQVAYDQIPHDERQGMHQAAAVRLAESPALREGVGDREIARHLELAGDAVGAALRYVAAARHALGVQGTVEAFRHLGHALALLPKDALAERFACRLEREAILRAWGRRGPQLRELHHLRREAELADHPARRAEAWTREATFWHEVGKIGRARTAAAEALAQAVRAAEPRARAAALRVQASIARTLGEYGPAMDLCKEALELCRDRKAYPDRAQVLEILGGILHDTARLSDALEAYTEALVIHHKLKALRHESRTLAAMGTVLASLGEYEQALQQFARSVKLDHELGDRVGLSEKLALAGHAYLEIGDLDKAEQSLTKSLVLAEQVRELGQAADATISLGQVYLRRNEPSRAHTLFERGLEQARATRQKWQEIRAHVYLGWAVLAMGDGAAQALALADTAIELARAAPVPVGEVFGLAVGAQALVELGKLPEALARSRQSVKLLDSTRAPTGAEEIHWLHAQVCKAAGEAIEAGAALARAYREVAQKTKRLRDPALRTRYLASTPVKQIAREIETHGVGGDR